MSSLQYPEWIDWTSNYGASQGSYTLSTGYRKITNLLGGDPTNQQDLQWLSKFNTGSGTVYAPIWDSNPEYVWYLDQSNGKLKYSDANSPNTYTINPVQNCKSSKKGVGNCKTNCCDTSSTEDKCMYSWQNDKASCGKNGYFEQHSETCDRWTYLSESTPITDDSSSCKGQDKIGTFCLNMQNKNIRMRSYLGCDLMPNSANTANISPRGECADGNVDDSNFCSQKNPEYARAQWKFIDDAAAVACCSLPSQSEANSYEQCSYSFNPGAASNKCAPLMTEFCQNYWGADQQTKDACIRFLGDSPMNRDVTQITIQNYMTSRTPQDYISRPLANSGNAFSMNYYNSNNCSLDSAPSDCDSNPDQPCCRDDSKDPFFQQAVPYMCNYYYGDDAGSSKNNMKGVCDNQLKYICQEFSRDDLAADLTLQNMCGCFLLTDGAVGSPAISGANPTTMDMTAPPQSTSPYYNQGMNNPAGPQCDVLCDTAIIQSMSLGGKCTQPVCMIDNVTINQVNSNSQGINFEQECGGGTCYISNVDINEAGSNSGAITLSQDCGTCYTFDGDNINTAVPVDCNTLDPISPDNPVTPSNGGGKGWWGKYKYYLIIAALIFGVFLLWVFVFSKKKSHPQSPSEGLEGYFQNYGGY